MAVSDTVFKCREYVILAENNFRIVNCAVNQKRKKKKEREREEFCIKKNLFAKKNFCICIIFDHKYKDFLSYFIEIFNIYTFNNEF